MTTIHEGDIEEWLVSKCSVDKSRAATISQQLKDELWISNVNGLRLSLEENPTMLNQLNLPHNVASTVKASLIKRLGDLTNLEVKCVLRNMFPDEPEYADRFGQAKITGIVLCFASSSADLNKWGISSEIHADVLHSCVNLWKEGGVPSVMLRTEVNSGTVASNSSNDSAHNVNNHNMIVNRIANSTSSDFVKQEGKAEPQLAEPSSGGGAEDSVSTIGLDAVEATMQNTSTGPVLQESTVEPASPQEATSEREVGAAAASDKRKARKRSYGKIDATPQSPAAVQKLPATVTPGSSVPSSPSPSAAAEEAGAGSSDSSKMKNSEESSDAPNKKRRDRPPSVEPANEQEQEPDRVRTRRELSDCVKPDPVKSGQSSADRGKVTAAPPSTANSVPVKIRSQPTSTPEATHPSVNATAKMYLANIVSTKAGDQIKGLHALHKMVTEDSSSVNSMRVTGAIDTLLNMLSENATLPEATLIGVLDVLNTIVALARDANVQYIMDKDLVNMVLPLCQSNTVRVRTLAVWILGNAGTVYFKDLVIRPNVLNALEESYNTILQFRNKDLSDVRDRFAETIKQLCSGSGPNQFFVLCKFIPAVVDIIRNEERVDAVSAACEALNHLIDANGVKAVDYFNTSGVIAVLIEKLSAPRIMTVFNCLRALSFIVACSTEAQMAYAEPVVDRLERLMLPVVGSSGGAAATPKIASQAALLVAMLCKGGERPLEVIMHRAPKLIPFLFDNLAPQTSVQLKQHKLNTKSQNTALALMYAAQRGNNGQLSTLLGLGVYTFAFRILLTFDDIPNLVIQTLRALRRIVVKVQNIGELQKTEAEFDARRFWSKVEALTHTNKAGCSKLSDMAAVGSDDSAVETENVSITDAKVRKYATRLYDAAQSLGIIPAA